MSRMRYLQALAKALRDEMERDPTLFVVGEDVRESLRGVTKGLAADFDDRVLDMPISEQLFTSFATGAALAGQRAVVEYQIPALLYVSFEQIVNQAHKLRLMTGGQASRPSSTSSRAPARAWGSQPSTRTTPTRSSSTRG